MRKTLVLFAGLLAVSAADAQTAPTPRMYDLKLSQDDLTEIGKLAGKAPFDEVFGLMSRVQIQLNAIGVADKTAAQKAADDAKAQDRAKIEGEIRKKIEGEKPAAPPAPKDTEGHAP